MTEINKLLDKHDPTAATKRRGHTVAGRDLATRYQLHLQVERFRCVVVWARLMGVVDIVFFRCPEVVF